MKKLVVGCLCLLALASCNVKNSDEYKALQAQRDSLLQVTSKSNSELEEMNTLINDVEENFRQKTHSLKIETFQKSTIINIDGLNFIPEDIRSLIILYKGMKEQ